MNASLELLQQVFLMATIIGREHDFMGGAGPVVGDVEQVANLIVQHDLAFFLGDVFADYDHAISLLASVWPIGELGHFFALQAQGFETTFANDLVLDVDGPVTQACHSLIACRPG